MDNLNHPMEKVANFRICKRRIKYNSRIIRHGTKAGTTKKVPRFRELYLDNLTQTMIRLSETTVFGQPQTSL